MTMLRKAQAAVQEFHEVFGIKVGDLADPKITDGDLRIHLIYEEYEEFCSAIGTNDLPEAVDALCDIIYVCLGAAVAFGVDLEPMFEEVQRTNMTKLGGTKREDGKLIKPEGWRPPDIAGLIQYQVDTIAEVRRRTEDCPMKRKNKRFANKPFRDSRGETGLLLEKSKKALAKKINRMQRVRQQPK